MLGFPPVVQATVDGHRVVAVRCSSLRGLPWLAIDIDKGWTIARADSELEEKVALSAVPSKGHRFDTVTVTAVDGGPLTAEAVKEYGERVAADLKRRWANPGPYHPGGRLPSAPAFDEGLWRIHAYDDDPFEGEAPEAWGYLVDSLDRYGFIDRIEHLVGGSWRKRSIRDLLQAAGGDPL